MIEGRRYLVRYWSPADGLTYQLIGVYLSRSGERGSLFDCGESGVTRAFIPSWWRIIATIETRAALRGPYVAM